MYIKFDICEEVLRLTLQIQAKISHHSGFNPVGSKYSVVEVHLGSDLTSLVEQVTSNRAYSFWSYEISTDSSTSKGRKRLISACI